MFSKGKKKKDKSGMSAELVEIGDMPQSKQSNVRSNMSARDKKQSHKPTPGMPSLISADVVITGSINADSEIQFDGTLEGDIRAKGLVIGEHALIKGEVVSERVKVSGTVEGAIRARHVDLAASANVKGDIMHKALSIETGARFDGNCRHSDDPLAESSRMTKPTPRVKPKVVSTSASEAPAQEAPVEEDAAAQEKGGKAFLSRLGGKGELR